MTVTKSSLQDASTVTGAVSYKVMDTSNTANDTIVGFVPTKVDVWDATVGVSYEWMRGLTAAHAIKSTTSVTLITSNGVTVTTADGGTVTLGTGIVAANSELFVRCSR